VRLASGAIGQCHAWTPQGHRSTYERILAVTMMYSAVVNYAEAVEIPLLLRHSASSSSSTSTATSQQTPASFTGGFSAPRVQHHPQAQGPPAYVQRPFAPPGVGTFSRPSFSTHGRDCFGFVIILYYNCTGRPPPIPTLWPRQQPPAPSPLQLPATDIPSSSTPPPFQFQAQPGGFDMDTEDQLAWDEFRVEVFLD
jgi:hypothetical protein